MKSLPSTGTRSSTDAGNDNYARASSAVRDMPPSLVHRGVMNSTVSSSSINEDERRLLALGYRQEVKRIFSAFTNFGLAASMISVLLGVIPLYTYQLMTGGPVVMIWSWIVVGIFTVPLVMSLGEICSAFPTMGALYFWAFKLGGPEWGPFASWIAGWCNLLGQIAGVASGGFAGAQIISELVAMFGGRPSSNDVIYFYLLMLVVAGIVNTFAETMLTALCYISVAWQIMGVLVIVISMLAMAPELQTAKFVFTEFHQEVGFPGQFAYVALIGSLTAGSTFTGYDTAAHVAEETTESHQSTPKAMLWAVYNCFILGIILIVGMNFSIQGSVADFLNQVQDDDTGVNQAYTILFRSTVGDNGAIVFLFITLVAIECSNCANLTSAARMLYSFSRDGALPFSNLWYHIDPRFGGPVRAIWLCLLIAFLLGLPSIGSSTVLGALFSLTATGLYASYVIPIFLRVTVARYTFKPREYNLGNWSIVCGWISVCWGLLIMTVLCLQQENPTSISNLNYSGVALGAVLTYALLSWFFSARNWYRVAVEVDLAILDSTMSPQPCHHNLPSPLPNSLPVPQDDTENPVHAQTSKLSFAVPRGSATFQNGSTAIRSSQLHSADSRLSELQLGAINSLKSSAAGAEYIEDPISGIVERHLTESSSSAESAESISGVPVENVTQLAYETVVPRDEEEFDVEI
jgi:amino acid transporter